MPAGRIHRVRPEHPGDAQANERLRFCGSDACFYPHYWIDDEDNGLMCRCPGGLTPEQRMVRYGTCEHCGEPRDVKQFMVGVNVHMALWCPSCDQEAG